MSQDSAKFDSKSEAERLLGDIVDQKLHAALGPIKRDVWLMGVGIAAVLLVICIFFYGAIKSVREDRSSSMAPGIESILNQPTSIPKVGQPTVSADPRAQIIGTVSALMASADGKVSTEDVVFAYKLFAKRLHSDFGVAAGTYPENAKLDFIDRSAIREQFEDRLEYLTTFNNRMEPPRHISEVSPAEVLRKQEISITALYDRITQYVPASGDKDAPAARAELVKQTINLARVWTEQATALAGGANKPEAAQYQLMLDRIADRLDIARP
ncbi:hypothetical protein IFT48_03125 [Pseudomonas fluorescens]|uniref:hypothetical protein n=1 Tax=Pseudomonas fluorescens TaxID=294 RepID=UPI001930D87D|nr:hypothetical protein [Pseudomonas fluorescens]MBD8088960.1 hypothetical protein [Pseudomonas fluorescens]